MNGSDLILYLLALCLLILLSAFFSGSETALFSVNRIQLKRLQQGTTGERTVGRLLQDPQRLLSTILVGNMLINVLFASLIASLVRGYLGEKALPIAIAVSTVTLLLLGEIGPKTVAVYHALSFSRLVAPPLLVLAWLFAPLRILLQSATNTILKLLRQKTMTNWDVITKEEIAGMLSMGEKAGATTKKERAILENILDFGEVAASDIMIPRNEVVGIDDGWTIRQAFELACRCTHARLPIYHDNMDDAWGIFSVVNMSGLLTDQRADQRLAQFRPAVEARPAGDKNGLPLYPALIFPELAKLDELMNKMKKLRVSMVVLVDEYGGTAGILTLHDILQEIVGRIAPAKGSPDNDLLITENHIMASGRIHIREFNKLAGLKIPQEEADTIGGYVMELLGRLPRTGDQVEDGKLRFKVMRMVGRRVGSLQIKIIDRPENSLNHSESRPGQN